MLTQPCIPGINPTSSCCTILFICCCVQFANIFVEKFYIYIPKRYWFAGFFSRDVLSASSLLKIPQSLDQPSTLPRLGQIIGYLLGRAPKHIFTNIYTSAWGIKTHWHWLCAEPLYVYSLLWPSQQNVVSAIIYARCTDGELFLVDLWAWLPLEQMLLLTSWMCNRLHVYVLLQIRMLKF